MKIIEMRSDTFSLPTVEMLKSIQTAELGDDVYQEDPTVVKLENKVAEILGKDAAILMPSGTMANLASILAHCPRGSKVVVSDESDIFIYEAAGAAVCGGVMYDPVSTELDGSISLSRLEERFPVEVEDPQFALPALICLENPHNRMGGKILPLTYLREIKEFANRKGVPIHMDGARLFNATVALGVDPIEITKYVDSVQVCLSKGIAAPIGSLVAGDKAFIQKVYRLRKMLGGGMRQAGIIAAPGIFALDTMKERLRIDNENAIYLASQLVEIKGIEVVERDVEINMVFFQVNHPEHTWTTFIQQAKRKGLNLAELGHGRIRAVTHHGVTREDINQAVYIIKEILG